MAQQHDFPSESSRQQSQPLVHTATLPMEPESAAEPAGLAGDGDDAPLVPSKVDVANRFHAIVELAPDGTVVTDHDGRIVLVNRQTELLFGYARAELLGQSVDILIPQRLHAAHRQHRIDYLTAPRTRPMGSNLQLFGRRRDGSEFPVEVSLSPLDDAGEFLVIASIRDCSAARRAEAARAAIEVDNQELRLLQAITDTALSYLALDDLLHELLDRTLAVMAVDNVAILLLDADGQTMRVRACRGVEEGDTTEIQIPMGQGFAGHIAATREPLIVDDLATFEVVKPFRVLRSVMGVPLLMDGRLLGVIHLGSTLSRHFTQQDVRLLQRVADRMTLAIDRAHLFEAEETARREAQVARAEAERQADQLDRVVEAMADALLVFDAQGRTIRTNTVARRLLGLDAAAPDYYQLRLPERLALHVMRDAQGRPLAPEDAASARALRGDMLVGSKTVDFWLRALDGREREFSATGGPLRDHEGHIVGAVLILRDLTERNRLEREHAEQGGQLDRIFEAMADGLVVYDTQGRTVRANAASRRLLALDAATSDYFQLPIDERRSLFDLRDGEGHPLAHEAGPMPRALTEEMLTGANAMDVRMRALDGREMEFSVTGGPLRDRDGHIVGAVCLFRDQTDRNRLAREREEARASELALQETTRRMNEFLGMASHELKSPLGSLQLALQALMQRLYERPASRLLPQSPPEVPVQVLAEAQPFLAVAERAVQRMVRLVGDLLDVTRTRVGALDLRLAPCDLETIVRETVEEQHLSQPARTIRLEGPSPIASLPIVADALRIGQVVSNYLSNALKYSPTDRPVTVRMEAADTTATVSVRDEGPGIPTDEQTRIWELYHRVPGVTAHENVGIGVSLGLGLHIGRAIIEQHGGQVGLSSEVGKGSTFWFTLPLAAGGAPL